MVTFVFFAVVFFGGMTCVCFVCVFFCYALCFFLCVFFGGMICGHVCVFFVVWLVFFVV